MAACSVHGRGVFLPKCGRGPSRFWPSAALQSSLACASERRGHSVACAELRRCFRCLVYDDRLRTLATSQDAVRRLDSLEVDTRHSSHETREQRAPEFIVHWSPVKPYCVFMCFKSNGFTSKMSNIKDSSVKFKTRNQKTKNVPHEQRSRSREGSGRRGGGGPSKRLDDATGARDRDARETRDRENVRRARAGHVREAGPRPGAWGGVAGARLAADRTVYASPYSEPRKTLNRRAAARASGPDAATGELAASRPALGLGPHTLTHVSRHVTGTSLRSPLRPQARVTSPTSEASHASHEPPTSSCRQSHLLHLCLAHSDLSSRCDAGPLRAISDTPNLRARLATGVAGSRLSMRACVYRVDASSRC